jgi:hypothetical protein
MPIEMLIATKDSRNRRNEESELNNGLYVSRAAVGDKTLKDAQIFEDAASRQISGDKMSRLTCQQATALRLSSEALRREAGG